MQNILPIEASMLCPVHPLKLEITMSRIILACCFGGLLATAGARNANAIGSADQAAWAQTRLACADVGIDPDTGAFGQCVFDLYYSLWDEQNESER